MKTLISLLVAMTFVQSAYAAEESYDGFDSIVRELSSSSTQVETPRAEPVEMIRFHGGVGLVTSQVRLDLPKTLPQTKSLQGVEARFGIDLFDPNWIAEGAIRGFSPQTFGDGEISLREFDLLIRYRQALNSPIYFSVGAGMAARYLQFSRGIDGVDNPKPSTPASVFSLGFETELGPKISAGLGFSYRARMISDTPDQQALDGSLQIMGHF